MALITRCPVCGTRFKVVPDQLRISDGWVRCGECGEVFDASADLSQGELPSPVVPPADPGLAADSARVRPQSDWHAPWSSRPPTVVSESANAAPTLASGSIARAARIDWDAEASFSETWLRKRDASYGDDAEGADSLSLPASLENRHGRRLLEETEPEPAPAQALADELDEAVPEAEASPPPAEVPAAEAYKLEDKYEDDEEEDPEEVSQALAAFPADMSTLPEDTVYVVPPPPAQVDAALDDEPRLSFLKADVRPAISAWQRPWVRPALMGLAGLLTLTLIGQAAVQQRDVLAAQMPATKPLLQALCAPFGCTVQPLRRIESIVIDNSTFTTLRRGVYRLNVVLKNRSATELAVPSIELALTDTQEQPVLRRVLQPVDMAVVSGNISPIAPDGEWTASMELSVAEEALIGRIVGYRLLAFYP